MLPLLSTWDFPHSKRLMQTSRISWKPPENPGQVDETKVDSHRNCCRHLSLLGREHCGSQLMLAVCIQGTHLPSLFIQALFITTDQDVLEAHRNLGCFVRFPTQCCTQKARSPSESDEARSRCVRLTRIQISSSLLSPPITVPSTSYCRVGSQG